MGFERYQPNSPIKIELKKYPKSGIEILEIDERDSRRRNDWLYVVERLCCGKREIVQHRSVLRRLNKERCVCNICQAVFVNDEIPKKEKNASRRRKELYPYDILYKCDWPVPDADMADPPGIAR